MSFCVCDMCVHVCGGVCACIHMEMWQLEGAIPRGAHLPRFFEAGLLTGLQLPEQARLAVQRAQRSECSPDQHRDHKHAGISSFYISTGDIMPGLTSAWQGLYRLSQSLSPTLAFPLSNTIIKALMFSLEQLYPRAREVRDPHPTTQENCIPTGLTSQFLSKNRKPAKYTFSTLPSLIFCTSLNNYAETFPQWQFRPDWNPAALTVPLSINYSGFCLNVFFSKKLPLWLPNLIQLSGHSLLQPHIYYFYGQYNCPKTAQCICLFTYQYTLLQQTSCSTKASLVLSSVSASDSSSLCLGSQRERRDLLAQSEQELV